MISVTRVFVAVIRLLKAVLGVRWQRFFASLPDVQKLWWRRLATGRKSKDWYSLSFHYYLWRPSEASRTVGRLRGIRDSGAEPPFVGYSGSQSFSAQKKTILIVLHDDTKTGAPLIGLDFGTHFSKTHNVAFLVLRPTPEFLPLHEPSFLIAYPSFPESLPDAIEALCEIFDFDFALVNSIVSAPALPSLFARQVPSVTCVHEFPDDYEPFALTAGRYSTVVVFSTVSTLSSFRELNGVGSPPAHVVPQWFSSRRQAEPVDSHRQVTITGCGTVSFRKGTDLFVEVCKAIWNQKLEAEDFSFQWIGGYGGDHSYLNALRRQIKFAGLEGKILLKGPLEDPVPEFLSSKVFLLTSRLDPLPNVVMESAGNGVPFLAFDGTNGFQALLSPGFDHLFVPQFDVTEMAKRTLEMLRNHGEHAQLGRALKDYFLDTFSESKSTDLMQIAISDAKVARREIHLNAERLGAVLAKITPSLATIPSVATIEQSIQIARNNAGYAEVLPGFGSGHYSVLRRLELVGPEAALHFIEAGSPDGPWCYSEIELAAPSPPESPGEYPLIHIHAHELEGLDSITQRLSGQSYDFRLVVSITKEENRSIVAKELRKASLAQDTDIFLVENLGRNFGAIKQCHNAGLFQGSTVVCHVHNKKSPHARSSRLHEWRNNLFTGLLGDPRLGTDASGILKLFALNDDVLLAYPKAESQHGWQDPRNTAHAERIAQSFGLPQLPYLPDYPTGGMHWIRTSALAHLYGSPLSDFLLHHPEPLASDGTPLHAWERVFPYILAEQGGRFAKTFWNEPAGA